MIVLPAVTHHIVWLPSLSLNSCLHFIVNFLIAQMRQLVVTLFLLPPVWEFFQTAGGMNNIMWRQMNFIKQQSVIVDII